MDLLHAFHAVNTPARVRGTSDRALAQWVEQTAGLGSHPPVLRGAGKAVSPAAGLANGVVLRAIDALHRLAVVTGPRFQDDLHDVYLRWALYRYLGTFDVAPLDRLVLSDPGRRVVGNQRRVMSEDLGVAFGLEIAAEWLRARYGRVPIHFIDIDSALTAGGVAAGGRVLRATHVDTVRPDYVGVVDLGAGTHRLVMVECKGSRSSTYARKQLVKAVRQLEGVTLAGRIPPGLAVATIFDGGTIRYFAVDPEDEDVEFGIVPYGGDFALPDDARVVALSEAEVQAFGTTAVRASWAQLADFAGNADAFTRWSPEIVRERVRRTAPERLVIDSPYGPTRGVTAETTVQGQRVRVSQGLAQEVDAALTEGGPDDVERAQRAFAERLPEREHVPGVSVTEEGSVLQVELL